jgi:hypothetical protein
MGDVLMAHGYEPRAKMYTVRLATINLSSCSNDLSAASNTTASLLSHLHTQFPQARFLSTLRAVVGAAGSGFVFAGAAFLVAVFFAVVFVTFKALPTLFTIVVPVEVVDMPEVLLLVLTTRDAAVSAPLFARVAVVFGSVAVFAGLRAAPTVVFILCVFSLTILASMLVAVAVAALMGD